MEQHVLTFLTRDHQEKHILYQQQKGTHKMPFFLELSSQFHNTPCFVTLISEV